MKQKATRKATQDVVRTCIGRGKRRMTRRSQDKNKWSCHERKRNVQSGWRSRCKSLRARKRGAQVGQK